MRRLLLAAWLLIVWVALWEDASAANLLSGALVAGAIVLLFPLRSAAATRTRVRIIPTLRFLGYFTWKLLEANAVVAWEVVTPRNRINEGIVAVPVPGGSDWLITVIGNAITLTPGTLTVEARTDPAVIYVHVLHLNDIDRVRRDLAHLVALAVHAFGSDDAVATISEESP